MITDHKTAGIHEFFTPSSSPFGIRFSEWTVRWWQWCLSQSKSINPVNDRKITDMNSANKQIYPHVWFLAGTTGGYAERQCIIPKGKAILCPIINFEVSTAEEPSLRTDVELISYARNDVDKIAKLDIAIDGTNYDLPKFRVASGAFDITLPKDNIWGVKEGPTRAAADGYWLFLKPLPPGKHTLRFGGSCLAGTINIAALYHLTIE